MRNLLGRTLLAAGQSFHYAIYTWERTSLAFRSVHVNATAASESANPSQRRMGIAWSVMAIVRGGFFRGESPTPMPNGGRKAYETLREESGIPVAPPLTTIDTQKPPEVRMSSSIGKISAGASVCDLRQKLIEPGRRNNNVENTQSATGVE